MKQLSLVSLLAASVAGNVFLFDKGAYVQVEIIEGITAGAVELTGDSKDPIAAKLTEEQTKSKLVCKTGGASNYPDRLYCTDSAAGGTFGGLVDEAVAADLLDEANSKLDEVGQEIVLEVGEGGKLYVSATEAPK